MNTCQNCGQANSKGSNFCRFCGIKIPVSRQINQPMPKQMPKQTMYDNRVGYEFSPPGPYSWKTDEFQIKEEKQTKPINRVQPLVRQPPLPTQKDMQMPNQFPAQFQQNYMTQEFFCPRCSSQAPPKFEKKISTAGWIVFAVLLATIFPLFWIGLLIKEDVKKCQICGLVMN